MQISQSFDVARPREQVWALFQDVPSVAGCIPGAKLLEDKGDGVYSGTVESRLGPITAVFEGEGALTTDAPNWTGTLVGSGRDRKAGSRAKATIEYRLEAVETGTRVAVESDITLSGAAAQFGRPGLVRELTARILKEFGANIEARIGAAPAADAAAPAPPPQIGSLVLPSLWAWLRSGLRRLFGTGGNA